MGYGAGLREKLLQANTCTTKRVARMDKGGMRRICALRKVEIRGIK